MKITELQFKSRPSNEKEALKRAKMLKSYLDEKTGVSWGIDVFQNLGWHPHVFYSKFRIGFSYYGSSDTGVTQFPFHASTDGGGTLSQWYDKDAKDVDPYIALQKAIAFKRKVLEGYWNGFQEDIKDLKL